MWGHAKLKLVVLLDTRHETDFGIILPPYDLRTGLIGRPVRS
jgi:hypothetical protein